MPLVNGARKRSIRCLATHRIRAVCKRNIDQVEAVDFVEPEEDGSRWRLKKGSGGARILMPVQEQLDSSDVPGSNLAGVKGHCHSRKWV